MSGSREASTAERRFHGSGLELRSPESHDELREIVLECREAKRPLVPAGLGRHAYVGNTRFGSSEPLIVSLEKLSTVPRYEPEDFTVGVEAGAPLVELRKTLAANGQEIPVDFASATAGTIGGAVSADSSGPRRARHGTYRNLIIGITGMRGDGTVYRAGGMVVKNVAGYDVGKLLVGSLGTLGIILEINFKLRPIARRRSAQVASFSDFETAWRLARALDEACLEPASLSVLDPASTRRLAAPEDGGKLDALDGWSVFWTFEGNDGSLAFLGQSVDALISESGATGRVTLEGDEIDVALERVTSFQEPGDAAVDEGATLRLSLLPTRVPELVALLDRVCEGDAEIVIDAVTGVVIVRLPASRSEAIGAVASELEPLGARGRLLFASPETRDTHGFLLTADPTLRIAREIQRVFDPAGIFCPGRMHSAIR